MNTRRPIPCLLALWIALGSSGCVGELPEPSPELGTEGDSILASQTRTSAASEALDFVYDCVWSRWSRRFFIDPSAVAIVGHSRGGETARYLAADLADHPLFDVGAIVGLAPTGELDQFVDGVESPALMLLYGTGDHDVSPQDVFRHYDRAGTDASQFDPDLDALALYKSLKLFVGATHGAFSDGGFLSYAPQRVTTQGYVLAYLDAHQRNDFHWYDDFIRGDDVPGTYSADIYSQYRDGIHRRVIESFTDANLLLSRTSAAPWLH